MRRVVQIATRWNDLSGAQHEPETMFALCDDGSMWALISTGWLRMPDVPKDDDEKLREAAEMARKAGE